MPVHLDNQEDNVKVTLSGTQNLATAFSFDRGMKKFTYLFVTNAGLFSWPGDDNTDISAHAVPIATDTLIEEGSAGQTQSDRQRSCLTITLEDNPSSGDGFTLKDGTNTVVFRFGAGGDVTVTIGGSTAATLDNLVTDINAATLTANSQEHPKTDTRADVIGEAATALLAFQDVVGNITIEDLGRNRQIVYLASGTASTVAHVSSLGE